LSPSYALCGTGREQSPVDLAGAKVNDKATHSTDYEAADLRIIRQEHVVDVIDNGHTIQVNYDAGSTLQLGEEKYRLVQYHFHAPSEHTVDERHFPMEMHLVHRSAAGRLAVIGVLIEEGAHNPAFDPIWSNLPADTGEEVHLEHVQVDIDELLPESRRSYLYSGSLTTPPCSEGVRWIVGVQPIELSREQIGAFTEIFPANNRPPQPRGERTLVIDQVPAK